METYMVNNKGQIVIPSRLRKKYGFRPGINIAFIEHEDGVLLKPMNKEFFNQFVGMFKNSVPSLKEYLQWKKE